MKVLLGHCFYRSSAPSGEDAVYRNEKKLLEENGIDVITYEKHNDDLDNNSLSKKLSAGIDFVWSSKAYNEVYKLIETHKPDIAHFHNIFPQMSTSVFAACKESGVPVVQTLHNYRHICPSALLQRNNRPCEKCVEHSLINSLIHKCYRDSFIATLPIAAMISFNRTTGNFRKNVDRYIALTEFSKSRFIAGGLPGDKISVKPNFIYDKACTDTELGRYVVFVGRLSQEKGVSTLIEACKELKHIPVKILGGGPLRERLEETCIQHNLNVEFLGHQNSEFVLSTLKHSRFMVIPSEWYEGFPMTIVEAYACGKPVLGTDIGSLSEIIIEGITGRKFALGQIDKLVNAMSEMWDDTDAILRMSKNARSTFEEKFTSSTNLDILKSIYLRELKSKSGVTSRFS